MASDFYFSDIGALPAIWSTRFLNRMMLLRTFLIKVSFLILITLSLLLISLSLSFYLLKMGQSRVLWYRKRPLCQLRHNHYSILTSIISLVLCSLFITFYLYLYYVSTTFRTLSIFTSILSLFASKLSLSISTSIVSLFTSMFFLSICAPIISLLHLELSLSLLLYYLSLLLSFHFLALLPLYHSLLLCYFFLSELLFTLSATFSTLYLLLPTLSMFLSFLFLHFLWLCFCSSSLCDITLSSHSHSLSNSNIPICFKIIIRKRPSGRISKELQTPTPSTTTTTTTTPSTTTTTTTTTHSNSIWTKKFKEGFIFLVEERRTSTNCTFGLDANQIRSCNSVTRC